MGKWYYNLSIKYKILLVFYFLLAALAVSFYVYSTRSATENIVGKVGTGNLHLLRQMDSNLAFMQQEIEDMSTQLILQPQIQNYIQPIGDAGGYSQKLYVDMSVRNAVNLIVSKDYVTVLSIAGFKNNAVPFLRSVDPSFVLPSLDELAQEGFYQEMMEGNGRPIWLHNSRQSTVFGADNRYSRVIMMRLIKQYDTYEKLGVLLVGTSEPALQKIYTRGIATDACAIAIFDEAGGLISSAGYQLQESYTRELALSLQGDGYRSEKLGETAMLMSYAADTRTGWTYLYAVPLDSLTDEIAGARNLVVFFALGAMVVFFPLIMFATGLIIRPIRKLLNAMAAFREGDFESHINFRYRDEIGQLGQGFNEMVDHIHHLVNRVYLLQIKEQEAQLSALQAQINPHFLYNTLDSIYWKAHKNGQGDIAEMVWHLSSLFRMTLEKGDRTHSVRQEMRFLEEYLSLQKLRYGGKVSFSIQGAPELEPVFIPRLTLQPIVENAIYHGIEPKEQAGCVVVRSWREEGKAVFWIEDDGVGMTPGELERLRTGGQVEDDGHSYAIRNIRERLELVYGAGYSLEIQSVKGQGTSVRLSLPLEEV